MSCSRSFKATTSMWPVGGLRMARWALAAAAAEMITSAATTTVAVFARNPK